MISTKQGRVSGNTQRDAMKENSTEIKKLTAMYNFKNIGYRIDKDPLQLKQLISKEKEEGEENKKLEKGS